MCPLCVSHTAAFGVTLTVAPYMSQLMLDSCLFQLFGLFSSHLSEEVVFKCFELSKPSTKKKKSYLEVKGIHTAQSEDVRNIETSLHGPQF